MNDLAHPLCSRPAVARGDSRRGGRFAAIFGRRPVALLLVSLLLVAFPSAVLAEESTASETITGVIETIHADGSITLISGAELVLADGFDAILEEDSTVEFAVESGTGTIDDPYVVVGATFLGFVPDDDEPNGDVDADGDAGEASVDGSGSRTVHVSGTVVAYDGTSITVGIVTMLIDSSAERGIDIRGTIDVGVRVKLHGKHNAEGVLVADQIVVVTEDDSADGENAEDVDASDRFRMRGGRFDIRGTLDSVDGNVYVINGTPVIADPDEVERLELRGDLVPGTRVRAKGCVTEGAEDTLVFFATEIKPLDEADDESADADETRTRVRGSRFERIDTELGLLTLNGQEIDFGAARVKGDVALETFVKVKGTIDADGIFVASRVDVETADDGEAFGSAAATLGDDDGDSNGDDDGDNNDGNDDDGDGDDGDSDDDDGDNNNSGSSGNSGGSGKGSSNSGGGKGSSGSGGSG